MTSNRSRKRAIRARMAITGEPYSVAARELARLLRLPRRVPGSSLRELPLLLRAPRPVRIIRDPQSIAAHLSRLFRGRDRSWDVARTITWKRDGTDGQS